MKKIKLLGCIQCAILCLTLCGCGGYREIDGQYMISSLGFSLSADRVTVTAETVAVGNDNSTVAPRLFTAEGESVKGAVENLSKSLTKSMTLDHCGIVIVEESIARDFFNEILRFCKEEHTLNLSVMFICAKDIPQLLSCEPESFTVGYDIMGVLKNYSKQNGDTFENKYYEISRHISESKKIFLPLFTVKEETAVLDGSVCYDLGET